MGESPAGLCVSACHSLGDLGGLLFTVLAVMWGAWQAHQRTKAVQTAVRATAEKDLAVTQLAISMRPTLPMKVTPSLQTTLEGQQHLGVPPLPKESGRGSGG